MKLGYLRSACSLSTNNLPTQHVMQYIEYDIKDFKIQIEIKIYFALLHDLFCNHDCVCNKC